MSEPSQPTPPGSPEPPAPPAPPVPPVPQYGEYAAGFVPPAPAPQYAPYAPAAGADPSAQHQYGQPYGAASFPQQAGPRKRKVWDIVLSVILLVAGLIGMFTGVAYGVLFTDPALLDEAFRQQGLGGFNGSVGAAPGVLVISHVLLYLLAVGGTIPLLLKKRVAFWVPLTAGVIAAIVFWVTLFAVILTDPALISQMR